MAIVKSRAPATRAPATRRGATIPTLADWVRPYCAGALVIGALAGCGKTGDGGDQMTWARTALERNDRLQVVAADSQSRTFTVRMKDSGALRVIPVDQIVAGPAPGVGPPAPEQAQSAAAPGAEATPAEANTTPTSTVATETRTSGAQPPETTSAGSEGPASPGDAARAKSTDEREQSPATVSPRPEMHGPHAQLAADAKVGSVLASGPGYSIEASGPKATSARPVPVTTARGTPVERLHDPIICQGSRLLHIDNRNLEFDGDALTAEDGCEMHITNTHIIARGIGVLARAANVHIENSDIEGGSGAIDASDGAQVYAEASRFKGLNRRMESSAIHDLGGNVWN